MPTYRYKSRVCDHGCECMGGSQVFQQINEKPLQKCPACGCGVYRAIQATTQVRVRNYVDYRDDLARSPKDPQAFVTSKIGLRKLIDQRQREGWGDPVSVDEFDRMGNTAQGKPDRNVAERIVREAIQEAGL